MYGQIIKFLGFPNCVGCIDGSLFQLSVPKEGDLQWVDRHGNHSLNAQGVCDADLKFVSLSAKWPGSVNDARVWRNSALFAKLSSGWRPFEGAVIIGDSIYPQSEFLMPMRPPNAETEAFYK